MKEKKLKNGLSLKKKIGNAKKLVAGTNTVGVVMLNLVS